MVWRVSRSIHMIFVERYQRVTNCLCVDISSPADATTHQGAIFPKIVGKHINVFKNTNYKIGRWKCIRRKLLATLTSVFTAEIFRMTVCDILDLHDSYSSWISQKVLIMLFSSWNWLPRIVLGFKTDLWKIVSISFTFWWLWSNKTVWHMVSKNFLENSWKYKNLAGKSWNFIVKRNKDSHWIVVCLI